MRTVLASIVTLLFLASAAHACPFSGHDTKDEVKKPVVIVGS